MERCYIHGTTPTSPVVDASTFVYREWRDFDADAAVTVDEALREIDDTQMADVMLGGTHPPNMDIALATRAFLHAKAVLLEYTSINVYDALCDALESPDCRIEDVAVRRIQFTVGEYHAGLRRFHRAVTTTPRLRRFETEDESLMLMLKGCQTLEEISGCGDGMWLPGEQLLRVLTGLPSLRRVVRFLNPLSDFKQAWPECCESVTRYGTRTILRAPEA